MSGTGKVVNGPNGNPMQIFPLSKGRVNITSGAFVGITMIHCVVAGDVVITWSDATTSTISCVAGNDFGIVEANSITVSSGTFHLG